MLTSAIFKNDSKTDEDIYRPIIILPLLNKVYEILMFNKLYIHFNGLFSKLLCGFKKDVDTPNCVLNKLYIIENGTNL